MNCSKCGNRVEDWEKFCTHCGNPVERLYDRGETRPLTTFSASNAGPQRTGVIPERRPRRVPVWALIAVVAIAVVAIVGILLFVKPGGGGASNGTYETGESTSGKLWDVPQESEPDVPAEPAQQQEVAPAWGETEEPAVEYADEYILPDSATRLYTTAELEQLSNWELFIARNEIYARHGRMFRSDILRGYFESTSWYEGTIDPDAFNENLLNETEKANAKAMLEIEKARNSEYL